MQELQVGGLGGNECNTTGESLVSKGNCVLPFLEGFMCSLVNLAPSSHEAHSRVRFMVVLEGADGLLSLGTCGLAR